MKTLVNTVKDNRFTNVRVDFFCRSYQYAEPKFYTLENISDVEDMKKFTLNKLRYSKEHSTDKNTFWATFCIENENGKYDELFEERIKLN